MEREIWDRPDGRCWAWISKENEVFSTETEQKFAVLREGMLYDLQGQVIGALAPISSATIDIEPGSALEKFVNLARTA
jgi:hypothetical protein